MPAAAPARAVEVDRPRATDPLLALADRCVQMRFVPASCPTYRLDRNEARIPVAEDRTRARIRRRRAPDAVADAPRSLPRLPSLRSGVPGRRAVRRLLVEARHRQRERRGAGLRRRSIEWLTSRPAAGSTARRVSVVLSDVAENIAATTAQDPSEISQALKALRTEASRCLRLCARRYDGETHAALARLCLAAGLNVTIPGSQTCCGALHACGASGTAAGLAQQRSCGIRAEFPS